MLPWTKSSWTSHPDIGPLSSSHKQRRTEQLPGQQPGQQTPQREQALPDFDQVVQGGEISPDIAEYLTPQMGNEAILGLLAQGGASSMAHQGGELEEEEVIELEEEVGELELEIKAVSVQPMVRGTPGRWASCSAGLMTPPIPRSHPPVRQCPHQRPALATVTTPLRSGMTHCHQMPLMRSAMPYPPHHR